MKSGNEIIIDEAYCELNELVEGYLLQIKGLEKQKINKAKIFYHREGNQMKYEQVVNKLEHLDLDLRDNLYRMAVHIL